MSSPTPIITPPPKKKPAKATQASVETSKVSLAPQGLAKARDVVKQYSTWVLAVVAGGPDLYQAATSLGMLGDQAMPESVKWLVRGAGGLGLLVKFISQKKPA